MAWLILIWILYIRFQTVWNWYTCAYKKGSITFVLQIDISKDKVEQDSSKKRTIDCLLNVGGKDLKAEVAFYSTQKTCHVWYPIAAIQEEVDS